MSSSSLKTYVIVLLVIINVVLIVLYGLDDWERNTVARAQQEDMRDIFARSGVALHDSAIIDAGIEHMETLVTRSVVSELALVSSVLGADVYSEDRGGNIIYYSGVNGTALFHPDGYFEIRIPFLSSGGRKSLDEQVDEFIEQLGVDLRKSSETGRQLHYIVIRNGVEVINQYFTFNFGLSGGVDISGSYVVGLESPANPLDYTDPYTASLRFLRLIESIGVLCGEISAIDLAYTFDNSLYTPIWIFRTDTGEYMLNAMTGELYYA